MMGKLIIPPELAGAKHVFEVSRTSHTNSLRVDWQELPPCDGAIKTQFAYNNGVLRTVWAIAIDDLDGLLRFVEKNCAIVIEFSKPGFEIEIYDGNRE